MSRMSKMWLLVGPVLLACGGSEPSSDTIAATGTRTQTQALWACDAKNTRVVCTAPVIAEAPKQPFYVCESKDRGATCPDNQSIKAVPGLERLLETLKATTSFDAMPWACIMTGKQQLQCARELARAGAGGSAGAGGGAGGVASSDGTSGGQPPLASGDGTSGGGGGAGSQDGKGNPTGSTAGKPAVPSSCAPTAWEPYFAELATYEYQKHGVSIAFPRAIFDCSQSMMNLTAAAGSTTVTAGAPSCHDGEWDMRQQAWEDAVQAGCTSLNEPIAVLCQQAANYAPNTGSCNMTGSW